MESVELQNYKYITKWHLKITNIFKMMTKYIKNDIPMFLFNFFKQIKKVIFF